MTSATATMARMMVTNARALHAGPRRQSTALQNNPRHTARTNISTSAATTIQIKAFNRVARACMVTDDADRGSGTSASPFYWVCTVAVLHPLVIKHTCDHHWQRP